MSVNDAIASRHAKDLIVGECKDGPTWGAGHRRLDYWVLRRSWAHPAMIGYEVKSSRRDFLADDKWQEYLPLCNELWFIADRQHILPGELPPNVGHLRLAGSRLITVQRAAWREIEPPAALLTYLLMCRATIDEPQQVDRAAYWTSWLEKKREDRRIGHDVSKALREKYERDVEDIRRRTAAAEQKIERAEKIERALAALGLDWQSYQQDGGLAEQLRCKPWERVAAENAWDMLSRLLGKPGNAAGSSPMNISLTRFAKKKHGLSSSWSR